MSDLAIADPAGPPPSFVPIGRPYNPNNDTPAHQLVAMRDAIQSWLYDFSRPDHERALLTEQLYWANLELSERFAEFVRADDGMASDEDLRALARGAGIVRSAEDPAPDLPVHPARERDLLDLIARQEQTIVERDQTIATLRIRIEIADDTVGAQRNGKLGAPKATGAALIEIFRCDQPKDPTRVSRQTGGFVPYRVPLARLARMTGLSDDACIRHIRGDKRTGSRGLADYTLPDGTPVVHWDVVDVPGRIDADTGEIVSPHSELWLGPGVPAVEFGKVLATINPTERKPWGGKRDDGVCVDHPHDGVIERIHYQKHVTYECATCNRVLEEKTLAVAGKTQSIRLLRHIPTPEDTGSLPTHGGADAPVPQDAALPPEGAWNPLAYDPYVYADTPVPQDAAPLRLTQDGPSEPSTLPRNLRYREPAGFTQQLLSGPSAEEQAAGLAALAWTAKPTPLDDRTDVAIGGRR